MKKLFVMCPKCGEEELFMTEYDCLKILLMKVKNWIVCKNCDYMIQIEKLKNLFVLCIIKKLIFQQIHHIQIYSGI